MNNINLIYIHLGDNFINYLNDSIKQSLLFTKNIKIIVVVNLKNKSKVFKHNNVNIISYEKIKKTHEHKNYLEHNNQKTSRNKFWIYTTERFFVLYEVMKKLDLKKIFHIESDNLIYRDLNELYPIFKKHFGKTIGVPFDNDNRGIGSFMYIPRKEILMNFLQFINKKTLNNRINDMELLSSYRIECPHMIKSLPIIFPDYLDNNLIKSEKYGESKTPEIFYNQYDIFESVFDAAAIGQYIGGCDPKNKKSNEGFVNETCIFSCQKMKINWEYDSERRTVPIIEYNNNKYVINNLHIHCKNLSKFSSKFDEIKYTKQVTFKKNPNKTKYLITTFVGGPNNQYVGFRESLIMANMLNRILILPIFSPHGTVKSYSKRKVYHFYESFEIDLLSKSFDIISFDQVESRPSRVFNIRNKDSKEIGSAQYYLSLYKDTYNLDLCSLPQEYLGKPWFSKESDFQYLNNINDDVLVLCGVFNNVKLSTCGRNHCLNCDRGGPFLDIYDQISKSFIRNNVIREAAIEFINTYFGNSPFISFHMRTSDYIGKKKFTEVYIGCTEEEIYNSLVYYCNKFYIDKKNIFLACPPGAFKVKDIKFINTNMFVKYKNIKNFEPYFISLIEQEICSLSTIFVRSITNTPHIPKTHTRSSWGTGVDDYRLMFNNNLNDISIDKLIDKYKKEDRKSYIDYNQESLPEGKNIIFDLFTSNKKDKIENSILNVETEKINKEIIEDTITINKINKINKIKQNNENNIKIYNKNTNILQKQVNYRNLNLSKVFSLKEFLDNKTTYSLKDCLNIPLDIKLKDYLSYPRGYFIEIGSYDGVKQSNTKIFEEFFGWSGILVEPSYESFLKCKENRPNSIVNNYAIVDNDNLTEIEGDFNGHILGSINGSRLNKKNKLVSVKCITLNNLLKLHNVKKIDLLCIDTNGNEINIIKNLNFNMYKPKFILIQLNPKYIDEYIHFFEKNKYTLETNLSNYNKQNNPKWSGNHNDYLFELKIE